MRLALFIILMPVLGYAQIRCGLDSAYFNNRPESVLSFETWLSEKKASDQLLQLYGMEDEVTPVLQVPVVFHIIHNGEPIGIGANLSDEKITEQLRILNEDFRRENPDSVLTPTAFTQVAADTRVEFVMARQDPEGRLSNGIVRKQGSLERYRWANSTANDDEILKSESRWPPQDYLNIYVADLYFSSTANTLGYATFPFTDLPGIPSINNNAATDGVVVNYRYIGINEDTGGSFPSYGRTLTHEIGHYLGLRHVWGDALDCAADDFCADTPIQSTRYGGECPNQPQFSCGTEDMFSNYLNYTDDACMNIFSMDQADRMRTVLQHSPYRRSLLTSPGLQEPEIFALDLGLKQILSPLIADCQDNIIPSVELRNYGQDTIRTFTASLFINDIVVQTTQKAVEIAPDEVDVLSFEQITLDPASENRVSFSISTVNGTIDDNLANNFISISLTSFDEKGLPYQINFDDNNSLETRSETGESLWDIVEAPAEDPANKAITVSFFEDSSRFGTFDYLISPVFDLSSLNSAELSFRYAYSGKTGEVTKDGLIVAVSTDCGEDFQNEDFIFERYGDNLRTAPRTDTLFIPKSKFDWNTVNLNLTAYTGESRVRIAFISHNANGNLLYLDDIIFSSNSLKAYDIGIRSIKNMPAVTCDDFVFPSLEIKNHGFETVTNFSLSYQIRNDEKSFNLSNFNIISGDLQDIPIDLSGLDNGNYSIEFKVDFPNSNVDQFSENNSYIYRLIIDNTSETLPLRENFEEDSEWILTSPIAEPVWSETKLGDNTVLKANAFLNPNIGSEHYFISPILEVEDIDSASMSFRYAYARRGLARDRLKVLLSVNCGRNFQYLLYDKSSEELSNQVSNNPFVPLQDSTWQEVVLNLSEYMSWDEIRLAFVFENGNGNNLFIDDIEFFTQATPPELTFEEQILTYPNPVRDDLFISLNLPYKQDLDIILYDLAGKNVYQEKYLNALNQQIRLDPPQAGGFLIMKVVGETVNFSEKILISR